MQDALIHSNKLRVELARKNRDERVSKNSTRKSVKMTRLRLKTTQIRIFEYILAKNIL
jgi:hypothetical protein